MTPDERIIIIKRLKVLERLEDRLTSLRFENSTLKHMLECLKEFKIKVANSTFEILQNTINDNQEEIDHYLDEEAHIKQAIDALEDVYEKKILTLRYVDCLDWDKIMKRMRYGRTQVNRIHRKALEHINL